MSKSVEFVPPRPAPALVGGKQIYLPAYYVFRNEDNEIEISPDNPNLMTWVQSFLGMSVEEWQNMLK